MNGGNMLFLIKKTEWHKLWIFFNTLRIFLKKRLRYGTMNVKL